MLEKFRPNLEKNKKWFWPAILSLILHTGGLVVLKEKDKIENVAKDLGVHTAELWRQVTFAEDKELKEDLKNSVREILEKGETEDFDYGIFYLTAEKAAGRLSAEEYEERVEVYKKISKNIEKFFAKDSVWDGLVEILAQDGRYDPRSSDVGGLLTSDPENRKGDCEARAKLFLALAKKSGLPVKLQKFAGDENIPGHVRTLVQWKNNWYAMEGVVPQLVREEEKKGTVLVPPEQWLLSYVEPQQIKEEAKKNTKTVGSQNKKGYIPAEDSFLPLLTAAQPTKYYNTDQNSVKEESRVAYEIRKNNRYADSAPVKLQKIIFKDSEKNIGGKTGEKDKRKNPRIDFILNSIDFEFNSEQDLKLLKDFPDNSLPTIIVSEKIIKLTNEDFFNFFRVVKNEGSIVIWGAGAIEAIRQKVPAGKKIRLLFDGFNVQPGAVLPPDFLDGVEGLGSIKISNLRAVGGVPPVRNLHLDDVENFRFNKINGSLLENFTLLCSDVSRRDFTKEEFEKFSCPKLKNLQLRGIALPKEFGISLPVSLESIWVGEVSEESLGFLVGKEVDNISIESEKVENVDFDSLEKLKITRSFLISSVGKMPEQTVEKIKRIAAKNDLRTNEKYNTENYLSFYK